MLHYSDDHLDVHIGDCREVLKTLPAESVHCVVTSPPYWGLRDYGVAGALGLEPTPEAFIASMVEVFREVRRVLRRDGTLWLNMGDSYAAQTNGGPAQSDKTTMTGGRKDYDLPARTRGGLKPKDLVGMPWRLAFALQADGWYLRSDIIWSKPNPMPESVTDRPTKAHEYVFLLTKSARYFYDAEAVREPHQDHNVVDGVYQVQKAVNRPEWEANTQGWNKADGKGGGMRVTHRDYNPAGRNLRSVWQIATEPYPGAHFATFPQKLVEPCIKAGTSERGVCPECGAPWAREVERQGGERYAVGKSAAKNAVGLATAFSGYTDGSSSPTFITTGWRPSCQSTCGYGDVDRGQPVPATVLDPFAGSGTTGLVANRLGRRAILIDLSAEYIDQAMLRNIQKPLGML